MGVDQTDCRKVAELIGVKTFLNEFVAFTTLGVIIDNNEVFRAYNGTVKYVNDDIILVDKNNTVLVGGVMEVCLFQLRLAASVQPLPWRRRSSIRDRIKNFEWPHKS